MRLPLRVPVAGVHGPARYVSRYYEANPAGDYWAFQWTDTVLLGGLALALVLVTVLLLRRRV
ncbi:hypothetical protein SVIOM342S_07260 [Streptomyces violaceorubidus]